MRLVERAGMLHKALTRRLRKQLATRTARPFQQLRALRTIDGNAERCTQATLAEKLLIDASAASRLVDRLVDEGLVERGEAVDRRCVQLAVTRAARHELAIVDDAIAELEAELVAVLGVRDARALAATLTRLTQAVVADPPARPARRAPRPRRA